MTDLTKKVTDGINQANVTLTTVEQALTALGPQIAVAEMLVQLGVTTAEHIYDYFSTKTSDDAILAGIMTEVDARIARRS